VDLKLLLCPGKEEKSPLDDPVLFCDGCFAMIRKAAKKRNKNFLYFIFLYSSILTISKTWSTLAKFSGFLAFMLTVLDWSVQREEGKDFFNENLLCSRKLLNCL
jgi:hypothetical protein